MQVGIISSYDAISRSLVVVIFVLLDPNSGYTLTFECELRLSALQLKIFMLPRSLLIQTRRRTSIFSREKIVINCNHFRSASNHKCCQLNPHRILQHPLLAAGAYGSSFLSTGPHTD